MDIHALLTLLSVPGIGNKLAQNLIAKFGSPERALKAGRNELLRVSRIGTVVADAFSQANSSDADKQLEKAERTGAAIITLWDEGYPPLLKEIYDPPLILFLKGEILPGDQKAVAIVGTRRPSEYGKITCRNIAGGLAAKGVTIVSGMARGIDSLAHRAALEAGGRTIAVLGSGLDVIYPPENDKLMARIAEQGAVITEFSFGAKPDPQNFPIRNRIISGISLGTLIVEAAEKSGALITATLALDQNRETFAVPGNIYNQPSRGVNRLIKEGKAALVTSENDIFSALGSKLNIQAETTVDVEPKLSGKLIELYRLIGVEPVHIDDLAAKSGKGASETLILLLELEMDNFIKQLPGKKFVRY